MKYVQASCHDNNNRKEEAFKVYVTSALQNMNKILAEVYSGTYMKLSFDEMLNPKQEDTRTADEIINHIKNGLKG